MNAANRTEATAVTMTSLSPERSGSIRWWLVPVLLLCAVGALLRYTSETLLKQWLVDYVVVFLDISLAVSVCLSLYVFVRWASRRALPKGDLFSLLCVFVLGLLLVVRLTSGTNRIYFDEFIYQNVAQSISLTGKPLWIEEIDLSGGQYDVKGAVYNKQPPGHPYYLSLFFSLFDVSEATARFAVHMSFLIGILALFFLAWILTESSAVALWSAAFYCLTPVVVIWSDTVSAEPGAVMFTTWSLALAALYARSPGLLVGAALASSFGLSLIYRPESLLTLPTAVVLVLCLNPGQVRSRSLPLIISLSVLFSLPAVFHYMVVRAEPWGSDGQAFALHYFFGNILTNGPFYFLNQRHPVIFTLLAMLGLLLVPRWSWKLPLLVWFGWSFGIFLFFYAGSYDYGVDVRYAVLSAAPLAVLAGICISWLIERYQPREELRVFLTLCLLMSLIPFVPYIRETGEKAKQARTDVSFAREYVKRIPTDAVVVAHVPSMWAFWGQSAVHLNRVVDDPEYLERQLLSEYTRGVYFHWNFWCNVDDAVQVQLCESLERKFVMSKFADTSELDGNRYALLKIEGLREREARHEENSNEKFLSPF